MPTLWPLPPSPHVAGVQHRAVLDHWLTGRLNVLPPPMRAEVDAWIQVLRGRGHRAARPRSARTIQGYLRILRDPLTVWSGRYTSPRQVTADDVEQQLDAFTGTSRKPAASAMRSLKAPFVWPHR